MKTLVAAVSVLMCLASAGCQESGSRVADSAAAGATTAVPTKSALLDVLNRELASFKADTGVFVKHLKTGEEAGVRDDRAFNSFSVIKLAILICAFDLSDRGQLNLDERVMVQESDLRDGSGILYTFDAGLRVTIRDLLTEMIITSDNSATDMLLARVGGLDALNEWLREKGFTETRMVQSTADFFRQPLVVADPLYRSLSTEQVFAYWTAPYEINAARSKRRAAMGAELQKALPLGPQIEKVAKLWSTNPQYWLGSMTPRETARMLEGIEEASLVSKEGSEQMKRMLTEQRQGTLRIPHYLPFPDYAVAHKTGDGPPVIANDVGIVYGPEGPIIISFFSSSVTEPYAEHEDRIGRMALAIVDHFKAPR